MHYLDEGAPGAPPMLMVHGNPTWSFYYRSLIEAFRSTHRVVAPDHLGCGLSDKPENFSYRLADHIANLESLVLSLDLHDLTLVLHDWGGAIGMGFALRHPERVKRFVLFNTAAFPSKRIPLSIASCKIPGFGALAVRGLNAFAKVALMRAVHHQERLTPEIRAGYLAPYDSWQHRVANLRFVEDIPMAPSHPTHALLSQIGEQIGRFEDRPMMLAWGARDFCFNDSFYDEWRRRFPKAEAHHIEDASHYVVEDAHERIVPWMRSFVG
jgi:haloalkane dehalogenase